MKNKFYRIGFLILFGIFIYLSLELYNKDFTNYYDDNIYGMNCIKKQPNNIILTEYNGRYFNIKCTNEQYLNAKENTKINISISEYNLNIANNVNYYNIENFNAKLMYFILFWILSSNFVSIYNKYEVDENTDPKIVFYQVTGNLSYLYCVFVFIYFMFKITI